MKKLISFIFCMTVIPALILAGAAGIIYNKYFSPTPMEYEFLRGESEIQSVEYAQISFAGGDVSATTVAFVEDIEGFIADIKAIECHKGITVSSFKALSENENVRGFVINYIDGSFEVITPYVCVNSDLNITKVEDLLYADVYGFDSEAIGNLLKKYNQEGVVGI